MNRDFSYRYDWSAVARLVEALGYPADGDGWDIWFKKAWKHLDQAGLMEFDSPSDRAIVCCRLMALRWIAHDFCGVCEGDEYYERLEFKEWASEFQLDSLALYLAISEPGQSQALQESEFFTAPGLLEFEENGQVIQDETLDDLLERLVFTAVEQERENVVDALVDGFGGVDGLFSSLIAAKGTLDSQVWERKESLWAERDRLEDEIDSFTDPRDIDHHRKKLAKIEEQLSDENVYRFARKQLELFALDDPVYLDDESSIQRLSGYEWCDEGCPRFITSSFSLE